jgi:hypothetical protein
VAYATGGYILSGAVSPMSILTRTFAGSMGIRYRLNDASSVALEVRRNSFLVKHNVASTAFRDTTLSLDGHSYLNTIGNVSTTVTETSNIVASLDAAYRFELWPLDRLSPFAEAFIGGSTLGAISSESVGIRYQLNAHLLFDFSVRADQLFSPKTSPERAFGLEATVGFAW